MKKVLLLILMFCTSIVAPQKAFAVTQATTQQTTVTTTSAANKNAAKRLDKNDPVKKWLYFALVAALLSLGLNLLGLPLAGIAWSIAGICLIIWLLKYLEIL